LAQATQGDEFADAAKKKVGIPQNLWVKKLGLCPRPQDFQGMAPVSKGVG